MKIEFHLLQNFSPSCLNRDDTNTPKNCLFGGVRRARVSSQCLKRAIRVHMRDHYGIPTGRRTRRLAEVVARRLEAEGFDHQQVVERTVIALDAIGFKADDGERTQVGLYLAPSEINRLTDAVREDWDRLIAPSADAAPADKSATGKKAPKGKAGGKEKADAPHVMAAAKSIQSTVDAADIALFGRMVAEATHMKVDAASQVAHAISTHAAEQEFDYFTAVDDEQPEGDPGAGMLGLVGYQSACFYRYALIDRDQLIHNLGGDTAAADAAILGFFHSSVEAIPSARQNGSAAHNWPDYVMLRARARTPLSLANAFERPVRISHASPNLVDGSIGSLEQYRGQLQTMYGDLGGKTFRSCTRAEYADGSIAEMEAWLQEILGARG